MSMLSEGWHQSWKQRWTFQVSSLLSMMNKPPPWRFLSVAICVPLRTATGCAHKTSQDYRARPMQWQSPAQTRKPELGLPGGLLVGEAGRHSEVLGPEVGGGYVALRGDLFAVHVGQAGGRVGVPGLGRGVGLGGLPERRDVLIGAVGG